MQKRVFISAYDVALIDQRSVGIEFNLFRNERKGISQILVLGHDGNNDGGVKRKNNGDSHCRQNQQKHEIHHGETSVVDSFHFLSDHCSHLQSDRRRPAGGIRCWP